MIDYKQEKDGDKSSDHNRKPRTLKRKEEHLRDFLAWAESVIDMVTGRKYSKSNTKPAMAYLTENLAE